MTASGLTIAAIMGAMLLVFIFSGYYLFAALGGAAIISGLIFWGPNVFQTIYFSVFKYCKDYNLLAVPLFVLMGQLLNQSGVAGRLFDNLSVALGRQRGGMAIAATLIAILFAATTGIVGASVVSMGLLFTKPMLDAKYNKSLTAGVIISGGTLGILIPPSIMLVILGPIVGVPVTDLFISAVIPGLLLASLYIGYSLIKCAIWPKYGPPLPPELRPHSLAEVLKELLVGAIPLLVLIFSVLGSIMFGIASPTEASACGAFAAIVMVIAYGKFSLKALAKALYSTAKMSAMILIMIASCNFFGAVFSRLGGATFISNQLLSMHLSPMVMLAIILIIIFFMGWAMEWIPIILILVPLTLPVVDAMGYDKLWYCMLVAVTLQTSWLSPPVALSAYYIKGALPHWKITDIYKGMFQYIGCQVVGVLLIILFPAIATWLPQALK